MHFDKCNSGSEKGKFNGVPEKQLQQKWTLEGFWHIKLRFLFGEKLHILWECQSF